MLILAGLLCSLQLTTAVRIHAPHAHCRARRMHNGYFATNSVTDSAPFSPHPQRDAELSLQITHRAVKETVAPVKATASATTGGKVNHRGDQAPGVWSPASARADTQLCRFWPCSAVGKDKIG